MTKKKVKKFAVCDGDLVLELQPAGGGWYCVTSPMDPGLHTQAKSIEEAFDLAHEALQELREVRQMLAERHRETAASAA